MVWKVSCWASHTWVREIMYIGPVVRGPTQSSCGLAVWELLTLPGPLVLQPTAITFSLLQAAYPAPGPHVSPLLRNVLSVSYENVSYATCKPECQFSYMRRFATRGVSCNYHGAIYSWFAFISLRRKWGLWDPVWEESEAYELLRFTKKVRLMNS
jgi:hypothetical protein